MMNSTPRRRMSVAAAVALAGGLSVAGMSSASAVVEGNLETTDAMYYCEDGAQKAVVYARVVSEADTINYTVSGKTEKLGDFKPDTNYGYVYTLGDAGGVTDTITFSTVTSDDSTAVSISVPTSCDGLPSKRPASGWEGEEVAPPGAPTDEPTEEPTEEPTDEPTETESPTGPPVETGVVSDGSNAGTIALVSLLGMGVVGAGAAATARLSSKR